MALPKAIQTARLFLASEHPYVAGVLWNLRPVEKPGIATLGVDEHWRLYYDPAIESKWTEEEITGVLFHEVNHILRDHVLEHRAKPFMHCFPPQPTCSGCAEHAQRWNWAGDAEINPGLKKLGFKLPEEGIFPSKFGLPDGLLAEEYFDKFQQQKQPPPPGGCNGCQPGQGQGKGKHTHVHVSCGGAAGNKQPWEDPVPGDGEKITDTEKELIIRDVAKKIEDHIKQRGNVPMGLERWAHDLLHPRVNWRKELRASARRQLNEVAGKREYSFKRPHRRQSINRTSLPTLRDFTPRIGVIRDTSGSMNDKDQARSVTETKSILDMLGGTIVDIEVDCAVHAVKEVKNVKQIKLLGGGGTDMGVGIEHAAGLKPKLDVCIVITDGYTPWPSQPPPFKCIVLLTQEATQKDVPSWAKTIVVTD
jgi:predicted metal-dependent peptidase